MFTRLSIIRSLQYLLLISLIAGAYFIFGLLGLQFKVPPGNAGVLWPPAGISLAAALLLGKRIYPGIFIGNFGLSVWALGFNPEILPIHIATGFGASACAFLGAFLIRQSIGFPNPLIDDKSIMLFMLLGGPISCLLPATIGLITLYSAGLISLSETPVNWISWWMGDTMGVLLFAPLMLTAFGEPQAVWRKRRSSVGLPLIFTFLLVAVLFFYVRKIEDHQRRQQLKDQSITLSQALKNRIQGDFHAINSVRNFFIGSRVVENHEFSLFSKEALSPFKEINFIKWISYAANGTGYIEFTSILNSQEIKYPNAQQINLPNLTRLVKDDLRSPDEVNYISIENNEINLYSPVFSVTDKKLLGVILTSISIAELVHQALDELNTQGCFLTISIIENKGANNKIIYSTADVQGIHPYQQYLFPVASQQWLLGFYYDPIMENSHFPWSIGVLISGLLFTNLLGVGLLMLTGRNFRTESIVEERTAALRHAKNAAEIANKAKSQLLANISHELRTPLHGILGFTQLLQKNPSISVEDKKLIEIIRQCGDNLLTLITDLLDISSIESNQTKLDINDFDFESLLVNITEIFKLQADAKHLALIVHKDSVPHYLRGDENRIRQIVVNLLNNAIKYTDQGLVSISFAYQDGHLNFSVEDTGCGIAKNDLEQIFSPFVQISVTRYIKEGVGLGLAITRTLVDSMGGSLLVSSQPGIGSIFTVSIPLPVGEKTQPEAPKPSNIKVLTKTSTRVLIADDNEINLLLLANLLELQGCTVDSAVNGQQALQLISEKRYELAFIDLNMPVMTGLEMIKILRSQHNTLKIIAISAYVDDNKKTEALNAGFDYYLTKPIADDQLAALVNSVGNHND
ncbi:MAG: response regulator [Methylococcales bacterium]|nr:response regulator [Methylococcales bacterium]